MAYMKKNVNLLLMLLVVTFIFSLVLLTTFYQQNYKKLSEDFENTSRKLDLVSENFSSKIEELHSTTSTLNLTSSDKEKLDELYVNLKTDKESLDAELQNVKAELEKQKLAAEFNRRKLSEVQEKLSQRERQMESMRLSHKEETEDLRDTVCTLKVRLDPTYRC